MSQQQDTFRGDTFQRLGSLGLIIGSVMLMAIAALDILRDGGGITQRVAVGFFGPIGLWGMMLGMAAIYRSITGAGAAWVRTGFYLVMVGTVLWTVHMSLRAGNARAIADGLTDGVAIGVMIQEVVAMAYLAEWLGIFFLGIGMVRSVVYPKALGWTALLLGILTFSVGGIPLFFLDKGSFAEVLAPILAGLTTIWVLVAGIWIARRAW
ncbi:MAG TPA: hypothetical protein VF071_01700 [Candidatus Limnocylindria bacterium]